MRPTLRAAPAPAAQAATVAPPPLPDAHGGSPRYERAASAPSAQAATEASPPLPDAHGGSPRSERAAPAPFAQAATEASPPLPDVHGGSPLRAAPAPSALATVAFSPSHRIHPPLAAPERPSVASRLPDQCLEITAGMCGTLGCNLPDFHLGPCSNAILDAKRRRR